MRVIARAIVCFLVATIIMVSVVALTFAGAGYALEGMRGASDGVFAALLALIAYLPGIVGSALLWSPALVAARRSSEEARVLAVVLSPLSFLVVYFLWRETLPGEPGPMGWTFVAQSAAVMMAYSSLFLFLYRRFWG